MSLPRIESLLKQRMGLDAASIGAAAIERAVRERISACSAGDPDVYWQHLNASEVELQELIEAVVVPETWFFRDREAFAALTRLALAGLSNGPTGRDLRVLSLPCATGEEPFSIAMALLDAGFPARRFRIDAVDISLRAIAYAERALYGKNSFRGIDLEFRERHFQPVGRSYQMSDAVRDHVRFRQANLFASGAFPDVHVYDFIFCRNVLIYFDRAGQRLAVRLLGRLLTPGGTLFVGPSESALLLELGYASGGIPLAFAFQKAATGAKAAATTARPIQKFAASTIGLEPLARSHAITSRGASSLKPPQLQPEHHRAKGPPSSVPQSQPEETTSLEEARRLADRGKVAEALQICQRMVNEGTPSADVFYLLGLLHDSSNEHIQAAMQYRKALYLDPTHKEALLHLAEALIREGATTEAQRLFDRAQRITASGDVR